MNDDMNLNDLGPEAGDADRGGIDAGGGAADEPVKKARAKKTAKKAAKKTTKKAAAKKTAKKATAKKTAKKAAKKTTKKAPISEPEAEETDQIAEADEAGAAEPVEAAEGEEEAEAAAAEADVSGAAEGEAEEGAEEESGEEPEDEQARAAEGEERADAKRRRRRGRGRRGDEGEAGPRSRPEPAAAEPSGPKTEMLVNYVPGDECRIAIVEDGKLEEFLAEPLTRTSRVGNIYLGRVMNVEQGIQAAFVDFGVEDNGFLHISDLHPMYFPGADEDEVERVGRKTPRRERPQIQQALKRGQQIFVQVIKEGIGTKGPTVTSYLSIPGRYLVMMPYMDKVGVSRKVEDEDQRRQMRRILDQLDLPDGFGFILRTAGMEASKEELERDLAYLLRLWEDMEKRRRQAGRRPRLLYSESDLLVRTLRDHAGSNVRKIIVDSEAALKRAAQFLRIANPKSAAKLALYRGNKPIFHAFGIEAQLDLMHAREVPLPSGGRLVIDETEALVAIDVNSGKDRRAKDAETNAYLCNVEAVDEICRQLRLRDLGGLVICDLIDMRLASHRREIENRMAARLGRDRAKSTILPISQFGILEMTRQRMRGSHESVHFSECPTCRGRGLVQRPDSVAADALRDMASLLDHPKVGRVELVVSPRVAGSLLSTKRARLAQVEIASGKRVDVRISESIPVDRVAFYAYEANGNDIDLEKIKPAKVKPEIIDYRVLFPDDGSEEEQDWAVDPSEEAATAAEAQQARLAADHAQQRASDEAAELAETSRQVAEEGDGEARPAPRGAREHPGGREEEGEGGKRKRRRRRRRGKGRGEEGGERSESAAAGILDGDDDEDEDNDAPDAAPVGDRAPADAEAENGNGENDENGEGGEGGRRKRRRRRRRRGKGGENGEGGSEAGREERAPEGRPEKRPEDRREPAGRTPEPSTADGQPKGPSAPRPAEGGADKGADKGKVKRRGLYSRGRRKLKPGEVPDERE